MSAVCLKCRRVVDVLVWGDWLPPWMLCEDCAAEMQPISGGSGHQEDR
jgi:hypothetical protein